MSGFSVKCNFQLCVFSFGYALLSRYVFRHVVTSWGVAYTNVDIITCLLWCEMAKICKNWITKGCWLNERFSILKLMNFCCCITLSIINWVLMVSECHDSIAAFKCWVMWRYYLALWFTIPCLYQRFSYSCDSVLCLPRCMLVYAVVQYQWALFPQLAITSETLYYSWTGNFVRMPPNGTPGLSLPFTSHLLPLLELTILLLSHYL